MSVFQHNLILFNHYSNVVQVDCSLQRLAVKEVPVSYQLGGMHVNQKCEVPVQVRLQGLRLRKHRGPRNQTIRP